MRVAPRCYVVVFGLKNECGNHTIRERGTESQRNEFLLKSSRPLSLSLSLFVFSFSFLPLVPAPFPAAFLSIGPQLCFSLKNFSRFFKFVFVNLFKREGKE